MVLPKQQGLQGVGAVGEQRQELIPLVFQAGIRYCHMFFSFSPLSSTRKWVKLFPLQGEEVEAKREKSHSPKVIQ